MPHGLMERLRLLFSHMKSWFFVDLLPQSFARNRLLIVPMDNICSTSISYHIMDYYGMIHPYYSAPANPSTRFTVLASCWSGCSLGLGCLGWLCGGLGCCLGVEIQAPRRWQCSVQMRCSKTLYEMQLRT